MNSGERPAPSRGWATSSLVAGLIWIVLAVAPTFLTSLLGLPVAIYAILVGWFSRRASRRNGDRTGVRRGGWGVAFGCAGLVYLGAVNLVIASAVNAGAVAILRAHTTGTPVP